MRMDIRVLSASPEQELECSESNVLRHELGQIFHDPLDGNLEEGSREVIAHKEQQVH
jgi:hypothetical protein